MKRYFLASLLFVVAASTVFAHGTGTSLEKQVGDYLVDIGYNPPELTAGEPVRFDFNISNNTKTEVPFSDIWVRIAPKDGDGIVFAGAVHKSSFGLSGMTFAFPAEGTYELTARFENASGTIAEAAFPLPVAKGEDAKPSLIPLFTAAIGAVIGFLLGKRRSA